MKLIIHSRIIFNARWHKGECQRSTVSLQTEIVVAIQGLRQRVTKQMSVVFGLLCIPWYIGFAPSQRETSLQSNAVSHWLGANLKLALLRTGFYCVVLLLLLLLFLVVFISSPEANPRDLFTCGIQGHFTGIGEIVQTCPKLLKVK